MLNIRNMTFVGQKQDDMVLTLYQRIVMRDNDLIVTNEGDNTGTLRQVDIFDSTADDLRTVFITVCDRFNRLGRAAPQRMHFNDITASHVREQ